VSTKARIKPPPPSLPPGCQALLSVAQVCVALGGITPRYLRDLRNTGQFPAPDTHFGEMPRWSVSTVNAWIEKRIRKS
jgi:predicted DNA-binding transcriptional regulator AlpA